MAINEEHYGWFGKVAKVSLVKDALGLSTLEVDPDVDALGCEEGYLGCFDI